MNQNSDKVATMSTKTLKIRSRYLNIPISRRAEPRLFEMSGNGVAATQFPLQLAEGPADYWVFLDVGEWLGCEISLLGPAEPAALDAIYRSDEIHDDAGSYREAGRPQFHFTVKRGWNNDVNGPIYHDKQYHLFWQAFVFGVQWDTGFMYWGHAVSPDLLRWKELAPALKVDKLGSPWSGTALIDHDNAGGWGKGALVLFYTAFNRHTSKQVQCIAYSVDNGETFTRFEGNPVLDTNDEVGSVDTRDPKVLWHEPTGRWVMLLFEKDGISFFTSTDLRQWTRKSHFHGLHECPDLFELPVEGDPGTRKWVLHGGSASYYIGTFDGEKFTPESGELAYAEGRNASGADILYAAQSFAEMPNGRCVQMAWGRIEHNGMPFNQMMLFPTEMRLESTRQGIRLLARPIGEIERLHRSEHAWGSLSADEANERLADIGDEALHVLIAVSLEKDDKLVVRYGSSDLAGIAYADFKGGRGLVEILVDRAVAEVFVDHGMRYILSQIGRQEEARRLELCLGRRGSIIESLIVHEMASIWQPQP